MTLRIAKEKSNHLNTKYRRLRLILGDQLNASHSWFKDDKLEQSETLYLIAELHQESHYVKHHEQKILAFFAAMEAFAGALNKAGFHVLHLTLDETQSVTTLSDLLEVVIAQFEVSCFEYIEPDEYRLVNQLGEISDSLSKININTRRFDAEHFLMTQSEIPHYFSADKKQRMETFYRKMRKRYQLLMDGESPEGGKWNYDADNRKKLLKADLAELPTPLVFSHNVKEIKARLKRHNIPCFGTAFDQLIWPITRQQALKLLDYFCHHCLPRFGKFQDAMTCKAKDMMADKQWSLYHSRLSFALNVKLIHPLQVVNKAIEHYRISDDIDLAQIEGFVRQIIGWREFIRGVYWTQMPAYQKLNHLNAQRDLPRWFWTGQTQMSCLHHAIDQSLEYAYAHHIQRLMVTGNFCLITGIAPKQVDDWYLGIYIDAIEWVEMPNTRGMSQFADGGIVGSKPYAASGNYINKMSDYCSGCHYDVKQKVGKNACPLNSFYWHFMIKHRNELTKNPRIGMVYRNWDKQTDDAKNEVLEQAQYYLTKIDEL